MSNYDLKIVCVNFSLPTKGTKKPMNRESFEVNVHNNPEFRKDLREGKLLGLFTHAGRYYDKLNKTIPYSDNIASHPQLANYIVEEEIVGNEVHLSLKLIDKPEGGALVRSMLEQGINVGVSMSTHCDPLKTDAYYITKLLGVDFTMDPAFMGTGIIEKNFSEDEGELYNSIGTSILGGTGQPEIVNFSCNSRVLDCKIPQNKVWHIPFSLEGFKAINNVKDYFGTITRFDNYLFDKTSLQHKEIKMEHFSKEMAVNPQHFALLKQMIIEAKYPPFRRLSRRIEELVREVKGKPTEYIEQHKDIYFAFINDPIYNWISKAFNSEKRVMLSIGLRLSKFVKNPGVVAKADRKLEMIKKKRKAMNGVFDRTSQKDLDSVLKDLFGEIWKFIENRSNTTLVSKEGVKAVLQNYDANNTESTNYRTIEEWLDAGSDGVKDYNIWIRSFPYNAKDKEEYTDEFYGYKETDELIKALANNSLDEKGKEKLAKIMNDQNVNNFSDLPEHMRAYMSNFDDKEENVDISRRTITDADTETVANKIVNDDKLLDKFVEKLQERGVVPGNPDEQNGEPPAEGDMPPADAPPPEEGGDVPPPPEGGDQQQQGDIPPPPEDIPPPPPAGQQADNNRFPKPKVISSAEASKLTGVNFSKVITVSNLSQAQKRKLISFSVVEMLDSNISDEDLSVVYFALGRPNGVSRDTIENLLVAKQYFSNGALSPSEYQGIKSNLLADIL